ncbi:MAG: hypothetical protein RMK57_12250 [Bryobacterales bacterium]|nr:hypothetical protein [Bryobacteraceae bacterium]MDW8355292.1 hypothetical protein [Bryobacterales bacterium]
MRPALLVTLALAAAQEPPKPRPSSIEEQTLLRLLEVRRVYVDRLTGGETAAQIRDMIISSLQAARLFIITENEERADAFLRGSAEDLVFTDTYSSSESVTARATLGAGADPDRSARDRRSRYAGVSVGEHEATRIAERKHEAVAAVRLVSRDGDVLWSTTQESTGAKFRGASADVADKVTRQLLRDFERARALRQSQGK